MPTKSETQIIEAAERLCNKLALIWGTDQELIMDQELEDLLLAVAQKRQRQRKKSS